MNERVRIMAYLSLFAGEVEARSDGGEGGRAGTSLACFLVRRGTGVLVRGEGAFLVRRGRGFWFGGARALCWGGARGTLTRRYAPTFLPL